MHQGACDTAIAMADLSDHKFKIGTALVRGKRIIGVGFNQNKTSPAISRDIYKYSLCDKLHGEMFIIFKALRNGTDLKGTKLYVARKNTQGLSMSRPCPLCWSLIVENGIKEVFYTNLEGIWVSERVNSGAIYVYPKNKFEIAL